MLVSVLAYGYWLSLFFFFFSSRRRHTRFDCDWSSDVCSSDLTADRERALGWIEPEDPGGVRRRDVDEARQRHAPLDHALRPRDAHPRLGAEVAAGHVLDRLALELEGQ